MIRIGENYQGSGRKVLIEMVRKRIRSVRGTEMQSQPQQLRQRKKKLYRSINKIRDFQFYYLHIL